MDDNRFFRWVWRINAILIFFVVAGSALLLLSNIGWEFAPSHDMHQAVQTDNGDTYDFGGSLGLEGVESAGVTRLEGTEEGFMVLQREGNPYKRGLSSEGYRGSANVNMLLFDLRTMQNHWLFPSVKQDIERATAIRAEFPQPKEGVDPVTALLMPVATKDTNGDGKIDRSDADSLYLYRPGSAGPVKLLDAESVSSIDQLDSSRVLVTYYDGKSSHAAMLSAKDFSVIASAAISSTPR